MNDFREAGVLMSYVNFQVLDHLQEAFQNGDDAAQSVIGSFSNKKKTLDQMKLLNGSHVKKLH